MEPNQETKVEIQQDKDEPKQKYYLFNPTQIL